MNISDIITKCYILALIIRDDGERLLLGDGFYEFKEQLQHFQPNTFQNDVIELQGTDGQLLAGQVRRGATQSFDGYIADSTISREATEEHRQRFLAFFRKKHHYKVVYVFPDGSAIKRERGYIVDAPSVPEMFQRFPEFHVGLNFEDVNYYEYEEGEDGEEIFAHVQNIAIAGYVEGGLIWDNYGAVSNEITWVDYALKTTTDGYAQITDGVLGAPLNLTQLFGNTTQQTYTGKNLFSVSFANSTPYDSTNTFTLIKDASHRTKRFDFPTALPSGTYTLSLNITTNTTGATYGGLRYQLIDGITNTQFANNAFYETGAKSQTLTIPSGKTLGALYFFIHSDETADTTITATQVQVESGSPATAFEPYCGGVPSPNPDYPQDVNVVSGTQTIKITGKNLADNNIPATTGGSGSTTLTKIDTGVRSTYVGAAQSTSTRYRYYTFMPADDVIGKTLTLQSDIIPSRSGVSGRIQILYCDLDLTNHISLGSFDGGTPKEYYIPEEARGKLLELRFYANKSTPTDQNDYCDYTNLQLEIGEATDYEPFQTTNYAIHLRPNIYDGETMLTNRYVNTNNNDIESSTGAYTAYVACEPNTTYIVSKMAGSRFVIGTTATTPTINVAVSDVVADNTATSLEITTGASAAYIVAYFYHSNSDSVPLDEMTASLRVEKKDSGIELCKIGNPTDGTWLDRIYEDDGEWFVHKEITKLVLTGAASETWANSNTGTPNYFYRLRQLDDYAGPSNTRPLWFSNMLSYGNIGSTNTDQGATITGSATYKDLRIRYGAEMSTSDWRTYLSTHNIILYYASLTATNTKITDQKLIQELSTIKALVGETDNIWLIPSSGAQGEMEVRYSRGFINQGAGYVWDAAQGGGPNIVSVDGIDRTGFVWEVVGPATNPTLTNITTNQTMTFEGDVAAGQTLTVNTTDQTANIEGTNVFSQMTGDWLELAAGNNIISYTATGTTEPSTIKWNGVVG